METLQKPVLTVYYDGLCKVCDREISLYKRAQGAENILFKDICAPGFDAAQEGVDPVKVHKVMHAKTSAGEFRTEVDAFIAIWEALPRLNILAQLAHMKPVRTLLNFGYYGFVKIRPYLPRKKQDDCSQSPYCEIKR